ncbi:hypothetical protein [Streptomyces lunaelactis]|nr:hypothetical protein [Streptomyces lunaelactis]NUK89323.1 hypothetical protein [Streptomyces lunaelactis]
MGGWSSLVYDLVVGLGAMVIAFDYRNLGLRFYDLIDRWTPGGGVDPRFSPDVLRVIAGAVGVAVLALAAVRGFDMF